MAEFDVRKVRDKLFLAGLIVGFALVVFVLTNDGSRSVSSLNQEVVGGGVVGDVSLSEGLEGLEEDVVGDGVGSGQVRDQWSYDDYNFQFAEGSVLGVLDAMIGDDGKVAFYLPPTGYVEVSAGQSFGVAFALNNPEPSVDGENYFVYAFVPDQQTTLSCGVDLSTAHAWMSMGQSSFGKIPKGWIDKMTIFLQFPEDLQPCTALYNFRATRDGELYAEEQLEFRIV